MKKVSSKYVFFWFAIVLGLSGSSLFCISGTALAISEDQRVAQLIEGAKNEKKVIGEGVLNIQEVSGLIKEFEKTYPFLKIDYKKVYRRDLVTKTLMAARAGRHEVDFVLGVAPVIYIMKQNALLMKYTSPEATIYPKKFMDADGYWVAMNVSPRVLVYNTKLVSSKEAPSSFTDLLDPKWKGKIGLSADEYEWFAVAKQVWGEKRATDVLKKLAEQNLSLRRGGRSMATTLLVAGEYSILLQTNLHRAVPMKTKDRAPIEWIPSDFAPYDLNGIALINQAPHINGATLFYDFVLSKRGQEILRSLDRISPRPDVAPNIPNYDKANLVLIDPSLSENMNKVIKEFEDIVLRR